MARRAFVVVVDACGVGALPDASDYGDAGTNTLLHVAEAVGGLDLPAFEALGLGNILELPGVAPVAHPALHGRLHALGPGKDSTAGHWELMGVVAATAPPQFPDGLPRELLTRVERTIGHAVICNRPYNGIAAIEDYGEEHLASGRPILYTSQDSVLQLAAHVSVISPEALYHACEVLRRELVEPEVAVGRVIARPFDGEPGSFERTDGRRDYALLPTGESYLDALGAAGVPVHGVGKAVALFAGRGFSEVHPAPTNAEGIARLDELGDSLDAGFVFANLIETDQTYGHRKDTAGFHRALQEIDAALGRWLASLREDDLLIVTADHGCDPAAAHSDHTREHAPLLARFAGAGERRHDGALADVGASVLDWLTAEAAPLPGSSFIAHA
ncbi:MAG: phosphopentomutase [Solirubrobacteraceae bacterium]